MNPQSADWNHFWTIRPQEHLSAISWSKRRIIQVVEPYVRTRKIILDAGCGSGFFSKYFCDSGLTTVSLDYADKALEITRSLTKGRSRVGKIDLLSTPLSQEIMERFDIIFTDGLLEHFTLTEQNKILQNFKSVLLNTGMIITFVPNRWSPWELIRPFFMPGIDEKPFVLTQLLRLNYTNDLTVIACGGINTVPFRYSPDRFFGKYFGMLLYSISQK